MSDELCVLLRPAAAYRRLVQMEDEAAWKRAATFAFLFGCVVSLSTSGRVTPRLAVPAAVYASLIPLVEIAVLRVLLGRKAMRTDLFLMGHAAWSLWLVAVGAIFAFADPVTAFRVTGPPWGVMSLAVVVAWSGYTDWCFFRCVSPGCAGRNFVVQRVVCWSIGLAIFGGGSLWTGLRGIVGI